MKRSMIAVVSAMAMVFALTAAARGNWTDDFNGGADQTWTVYDGGVNSTHLFQNNRYELHTEGTSTPGVLASWVSESFTNGIVQAQVQQISTGDHFLSYLMGRTNPATMSGYVMGVSSPGGGDVPHLWLGKLTGGAYSPLLELATQPSFDYTNCQAEFSIIGTTLRGKVWTTGTTEPDWQIETVDSSYASGVAGVMLATYPNLGWNSVQVAFDNVTATVPEPGTLVLLVTAGLGSLAYAWRRRRS